MKILARIPLSEFRKSYHHDLVHDPRLTEFMRITTDEPGDAMVRSFINDSGEYQLMMEPAAAPKVFIMDDTLIKYRIIHNA